ncbi:AMIN-like domain-containing (lipo)protein [Amycolatopsis aidingensis]|uniref:AMIN-like domain-containing (lipo)protein n=1 Tax=Amycolatopsis aidingensis TaxID=2842453 RepID=UPI001C0DECB6|nr:hypothetical protein [Amycolatopsis aidingensis]
MRTAGVLAVVAAFALTTSCGQDSPQGAGGQESTTTPPPTTTATTTTTTTSAAPDTTRATTSTPPQGQLPQGQPGCAVTEGWNTRPDVLEGRSSQEVFQVRIGRHECFDRVVFDVDGTQRVGFDVRYVPTVHAEGSGKPLPVAGGAALKVIVRAPAEGFRGQGEVLATTGEYFYTADQLSEWSALSAVRFAGSFEGQSTFAIGARSERPMRAFTLVDERSQVRNVVVDIAHG